MSVSLSHFSLSSPLPLSHLLPLYLPPINVSLPLPLFVFYSCLSSQCRPSTGRHRPSFIIIAIATRYDIAGQRLAPLFKIVTSHYVQVRVAVTVMLAAGFRLQCVRIIQSTFCSSLSSLTRTAEDALESNGFEDTIL